MQDVLADDDSSVSDDDDSWSCPQFVWQSARNDIPYIHPFTGNTSINVETTDFSAADFYKLYMLFTQSQSWGQRST